MFQEIVMNIKEILINVGGGNPDKINNLNADGNLTELQINSINFIKAIVAIENKFDLEFDDEFLDLKRFAKFGDLVTYVDEKIKGKQ